MLIIIGVAVAVWVLYGLLSLLVGLSCDNGSASYIPASKAIRPSNGAAYSLGQDAGRLVRQLLSTRGQNCD